MRNLKVLVELGLEACKIEDFMKDQCRKEITISSSHSYYNNIINSNAR